MTNPASTPRWLTAEEMATWQSLLAVMHRLPAALDSQLRRDAGLTHFEYAILVSLADCPTGACTMTHLAERTSSSLSRLSHAMRRLEERRWASRCPLASDGRITEARITPTGRRKLAAAAPGHVAEVRRLVIDALSPARLRALEAIGTTITEQIRADATPLAESEATTAHHAAPSRRRSHGTRGMAVT